MPIDSRALDVTIGSDGQRGAPATPASAGAVPTTAVEDVDVIVVGYGPVGAVVANLLGKEGLRTEVIEREPEPYNLPRAGATDDEVLRIVQAAGLIDELLPQLDLGQSAQYISARGRPMTTLHPNDRSNGYPQLAFFYQPDLERVLHRGVERYERVGVRMGTRAEALDQDADSVVVWVRDRGGAPLSRVRARYLVGCDGGRSTIRLLCGIPFSGSTFAQPWLVVDAELPRPLADVPSFQFIGDPHRPAVTLPLPGKHHRWEFMVLPGEDHRALAELDNVRRLISSWVDPDEAKILRRIVYTFHARGAARWREGRVLLAGDAAHLMPPFAGQGLSAGIRDAHNLCWKLAACVRGEAHPNLLDSYERERRPHVSRMTLLTRVSGALVQTRRPRGAAARDLVLSNVDRVPRLGAYLRAGRFKPSARFRAGAFQRERASMRTGAGRLFPQPVVRTADGRYRRLDEVLGAGWALVGCGVDPQTHLGRDTADFWKDMRASHVAVVEAGRRGTLRAAADTALLEDRDGFANDWFKRYGGDVAILRPDRVVLALLSIRELDRSADLYRELIGHGLGATAAYVQARATPVLRSAR